MPYCFVMHLRLSSPSYKDNVGILLNITLITIYFSWLGCGQPFSALRELPSRVWWYSYHSPIVQQDGAPVCYSVQKGFWVPVYPKLSAVQRTLWAFSESVSPWDPIPFLEFYNSFFQLLYSLRLFACKVSFNHFWANLESLQQNGKREIDISCIYTQTSSLKF